MIEFSCTCGKKIRVADEHADKKGRCPACKAAVVVPKPVAVPEPETSDFIQQMLAQSYEQQAANALATQKSSMAPETANPVAVATPTEKRQSIGNAANDKERRFPSLIDVFLYPFSVGGIMQMVIYVVVPTVLSVTFGILGLLVTIMNTLIALYCYWYVCECVRDSAAGNVRAPDILTCMPDLSDVRSELVQVVACTLLFALPPIAYLVLVKQADGVFWMLSAAMATVYPMALLAVLMHDSLSGLNPILIIRSIFCTFFQYVPTVLLVWLVMIIKFIIQYYTGKAFLLEFIGQAAFMYASMLAAHILGRFFYRNSSRLQWEV